MRDHETLLYAITSLIRLLLQSLGDNDRSDHDRAVTRQQATTAPEICANRASSASGRRYAACRLLDIVTDESPVRSEACCDSPPPPFVGRQAGQRSRAPATGREVTTFFRDGFNCQVMHAR